MFASRTFSVSAVSIFLGMMGLGAVLFLLSQWFQYVKGYQPFIAGVHLLPAPLVLIVAPLFTPRLLDRFRVRAVLGTGMIVAAAGMAVPWAADRLGDLEYWEVAIALAALGGGFGIAATAASVALLSSSPQEEAGGAAAVEEISYELGSAMGVAAIGTLAQVLYSRSIPVAGLPADLAAMVSDSIGEAAYVAGQVADPLGARIMAEASVAFTSALGSACLAAAILLLASGVVGWRLIPRGFQPTKTSH